MYLMTGQIVFNKLKKKIVKVEKETNSVAMKKLSLKLKVIIIVFLCSAFHTLHDTVTVVKTALQNNTRTRRYMYSSEEFIHGEDLNDKRSIPLEKIKGDKLQNVDQGHLKIEGDKLQNVDQGHLKIEGEKLQNVDQGHLKIEGDKLQNVVQGHLKTEGEKLQNVDQGHLKIEGEKLQNVDQGHLKIEGEKLQNVDQGHLKIEGEKLQNVDQGHLKIEGDKLQNVVKGHLKTEGEKLQNVDQGHLKIEGEKLQNVDQGHLKIEGDKLQNVVQGHLKTEGEKLQNVDQGHLKIEGEKLQNVDQGHLKIEGDKLQNLRETLSEEIIHKENLNKNSETLYTSDLSNENVEGKKLKVIDAQYLNHTPVYRSNILTEIIDTEKLVFKHYSSRFRRVPEVDCRALFNHDLQEIRKADTIPLRTMEIERYRTMTDNCETFKIARGYITDYLTKEEKQFPIAYSILMYKDVEQTERLLRAIYRPQNIYCIHVDAKTSFKIFAAMARIVKCFSNVFMPSKRISVVWGEMSVLEPELLCMKELWERSTTWKYFINLTGQEFPLRTNYELVKILTVYNGSNDVEATRKRNHDRWQKVARAPHGIIPTKGAVHVAVSRGFVDYVLHDKRAHDLLKWTNLTKIPDETFFSTLNHNPHLGVPGAYKGHPETTPMKDSTKPYLARFKNRGQYIYNWQCSGKRVRSMCILGHGDLERLARRRELFANKFYLTYQPFVFGCLEERNFNLTRNEYLGIRTFNATWYKSLGFISNKVG